MPENIIPDINESNQSEMVVINDNISLSDKVVVTEYKPSTENASATTDTESTIESDEKNNESHSDEGLTDEQLTELINTARKVLKMMKEQMDAVIKLNEVNDEHLKKLSKYNLDHREAMPENLTQEEKEEWDYLNGLNNISMEEIIEIFGENHPCIGENIEATVDTLKYILGSVFNYIRAKNEYDAINSAFIAYTDDQEYAKIDNLQKEYESTEDPERKALLDKQIKEYYWYRELGFLAEPLSELHINRIKEGLVDAKKSEYWVKRTEEKIQQIKIPPIFLTALYHFEQRHLEAKYWKLNNCLLIHFMSLAIYADTYNKADMKRTMVLCMFMDISAMFNKLYKEDRRNRILDNIRRFEDQLLDIIETNPEGETIHFNNV